MAFIVPLLAGCAGNKSQYVVSQSEYQYERLSAEEELLANIRDADREFFVAANEEGPVWGRVAIFYRQYLSVEHPSRIENSGASSVTLSGKAPGGSYTYTVERIHRGVGYQYTITCSGPLASQGELAAKNLSRFLREGNLERSFLLR